MAAHAGGAPAKRLPGESGIWVLLAGDMLVFSLFFGTFLFYRGFDLPTYVAAQQELNRTLGLINTLVLLTGSLSVALGVQAARKGLRERAALLLLGGIAAGIGFMAIKAFEWHAKIAAGISLNTNEFFMFYFMYTGIHLLHVVIATGVLLFTWFLTRRPVLDDKAIMAIECGAVFWHIVDLLWVFLFALFYLVR